MAPEDETADREGVGGTAAEARLEGTILVIDDEEIVRNMTREMLTTTGLEVLTAESGAAGVALFKERHAEIGLILLDCSMPGMGGEETFRELRKVDPDVPILLSSGFGREVTSGAFEGRGLTGFLQKPYRIGTLLTEVRRCLGQG
jgi:DNA-binding NtrC family response regulator